MTTLPRLTPGVVFAQDYKIVRPLAEGGMGSVYVVEQLSTGKARALKVMHPMYVSDPKLRERFTQEARIGGKIASEHIVETVAAGVDAPPGTPWLVMELLEGEDLASTLARRGPLPVDEARELLAQLCDGLGAAHALGIVHRDLKPENLFVEVSHRRGVAFTLKMLDFGVARQLAMGVASQATMAVGTPLWMAPEQSDGRSLSPATDVWALGLIAFQVLTGKVYWLAANRAEGVDLAALLYELLGGPIDPASVRATALGSPTVLPRGFDAWFARCVHREPTARFQHANEAGAWLPAALDPAGAPPIALAPTPVAHHPAPVSMVPAVAPGSVRVPATLAATDVALHTVAMGAVPGIPQGVSHVPMGLPMVPAHPALPVRARRRRAWPWVVVVVSLPVLACAAAVVFAGGNYWKGNGSGSQPAAAPNSGPPAAREATPAVGPGALPPEGEPWRWSDNLPATWRGAIGDADTRWTYVMTLQRDDDAVTGSVFWTVVTPGAAGHGVAGETINERVEGHRRDNGPYLNLSGKGDDHEETIGSSEYHLQVRRDGALEGTVVINTTWSPALTGVVDR